jgi:DNA polymerase-3 subunit epsilon
LVRRLDGRVFVAHNADFDLGFIRHHAAACGVELPNLPVLCTLALSRSLDPGFERSHRLGDLCVQYGIALERAHDALEDALATAALLPYLIAESGITDVETLLRAGAPVPRRSESGSA